LHNKPKNALTRSFNTILRFDNFPVRNARSRPPWLTTSAVRSAGPSTWATSFTSAGDATAAIPLQS